MLLYQECVLCRNNELGVCRTKFVCRALKRRNSPKECEGSGWDTEVCTSDSESNADPTFANLTSASPNKGGHYKKDILMKLGMTF